MYYNNWGQSGFTPSSISTSPYVRLPLSGLQENPTWAEFRLLFVKGFFSFVHLLRQGLLPLAQFDLKFVSLLPHPPVF